MISTPKHDYVNLVIEGGGVLGVAHIGALDELTSRGILAGIRNFAGASAGAIVAGALSLGATSKWLGKIMRDLDFNNFLDYANKIVAVYNVLYYKGASRGDYFTQWYGDIVGGLSGDPAITLAAAYKLHGRKLVVSVTNVSKRRLEYISYKSHPDWPLVLAIRASMSIPGIFAPVEINGDLYVDGGLLDNYPMRAFHYQSEGYDVINPRTLGLMLLSTSETLTPVAKIENLTQYVAGLLDAMWTQPQKLYLDEQDWKRTIKIPTGELSSFNFSLPRADVKKLVAAGRKATADYLDGVVADTSKQMERAFYARICHRHDIEDELEPGPLTNKPNGNKSNNSPNHSNPNNVALSTRTTATRSFSEDWDDVVAGLSTHADEMGTIRIPVDAFQNSATPPKNIPNPQFTFDL